MIADRRPPPAADPPGLITGVPLVDHRVELRDRLHFGTATRWLRRNQPICPLDPAFLVGAVDAGLAVESVDATSGSGTRSTGRPPPASG